MQVITDKLRDDDDAASIENDWKFAAMVRQAHNLAQDLAHNPAYHLAQGLHCTESGRKCSSTIIPNILTANNYYIIQSLQGVTDIPII